MGGQVDRVAGAILIQMVAWGDVIKMFCSV